MGNIQPKLVKIEHETWLKVLKDTNSVRHVKVENGVTSYNQIVWQILGSQIDKDDYLEMLYNLTHEENTNIILLSDNLDKNFSNEMRESIQRIIQINQDEKGLSINRMVSFMEGYKLIPKLESLELQQYIREHIKEILTIFKESSPQGLLHPDFRRVFTDILKWVNNHTLDWLQDFPNKSPLIVWYGDMKVSESYFLFLMMRIGFDIVFFHPEGKVQLEQLIGRKEEMIHELPITMPLVEFPMEKPVRKSTVANRASQELDVLLYHDDSMLYRPWQFRDYTTLPITLKTTYDEIYIYYKEKALMRPNFKVENGQVSMPVLFSKISGISKDRNEYWARIGMLQESNISLKVDKFPFADKMKGNHEYHYRSAVDRNGDLTPEHIVQSNLWRYRELPSGLQFALATAITRYVKKATIESLRNESIEQKKMYLFTQALNIKPEFLRLLQQYDYPQEVPKLIVYNTEKDGELSREDAALLLLLNEFGIDIFLFNPTGQNDIELYLGSEHFDSHWLEEMSFDEVFRDVEEKGTSKIHSFVSKVKDNIKRGL